MPAPSRVAVIADLVASRKVRDRNLVQAKLQRAIEVSNKRSRSHLLSPYTLTLGDEFQAVLKSADTIFQDAFRVLAALYPVQVRFSFGIGTIETRINRRQAIGMDGPAFYNARKGMDELKEGGGLFLVHGLGDHLESLVVQSLALLGHSCRKWNGSRLEIFEGAGHFPHAEYPERFAEVVTAFVDSTAAAARGPGK